MADYVKLEDLSKLTQVPPRTGHYSEVVTDTEYEKGLAINFGINGHVCGSKRIAMGRTIIPPHTANERHVHMSAEAAMFIVRGTMILLLGKLGKRRFRIDSYILQPMNAWPVIMARLPISLSKDTAR